jgi:hypothetical protein
MICLGPPRKPGGDRKDRNWVLVISRPGGISEHIHLYGTHANDPQGAQEAANRHLGEDYTWEPRGTGFQAQEVR